MLTDQSSVTPSFPEAVRSSLYTEAQSTINTNPLNKMPLKPRDKKIELCLLLVGSAYLIRKTSHVPLPRIVFQCEPAIGSINYNTEPFDPVSDLHELPEGSFRLQRPLLIMVHIK